MTTALIIVDVQNDFCEGGSLAVAGGAATADNITQYVRRFRDYYEYIVATKDWHIDPGDHFADDPNFSTTWPKHCAAGTEGAEFHPDLKLDQLDGVFVKGKNSAAYSGFEARLEGGNATHLYDWLRSRDVNHVEICGIALDYCVKATVEDATATGLETVLIPQLTVAVDGENFDKIWQEIARVNRCLVRFI